MTAVRHVQDSAEEFAQTWLAWHGEHEKAVGAPHGFLAITSINWLRETAQRFPDAPGEWSSDAAGVHLVLAPGEHVSIDGARVEHGHDFGVLPERGGVTIGWGEAAIEIAKRGGYDIVRPRHPDAPIVTGFSGTPAYEPNPEWAVTGHYVPFGEPRPTTVGAAVDGIEHVYNAPGRVEFRIDEREFALTAFQDKPGDDLFILFTDATSGVTTYAASRVLRIGSPAAGAEVLLDFNRAVNLPCAYTDLATCPLPPAENRLPIAVEAGEQLPYERRA